MNMKKTALFLLLYICNLVIYAQSSEVKPGPDVNRNMGLEVSAGYSMALGSYASTDEQNTTSGYATGGWQLQLTLDLMGKKDVGLAMQYTFQHNPMTKSANLVFPRGIPDSLGPGSWSNHYLMFGPVFMKAFSRVHIDAKFLGGVIISSSDNFNTPDPTDTLEYTFNTNIATGFACQVSAGAGYTISPHIAFKFNLNLLFGWPGKSREYGAQLLGYKKYPDPVTGLPHYEPVYSAPVEYDIKKVVTTLNPSIGLVYRF
jgi:hypothetical protein